MKDGHYESFVEALSYGEELDFIYNNKRYGIVSYKKGWAFSINNKLIGDYYEHTSTLLDSLIYEGKTLREFLNSIEY